MESSENVTSSSLYAPSINNNNNYDKHCVSLSFTDDTQRPWAVVVKGLLIVLVQTFVSSVHPIQKGFSGSVVSFGEARCLPEEVVMDETCYP